ncbi:MAG: PEP-CTERM sorting domain-containing protein [Planctomycetota bacterium]
MSTKKITSLTAAAFGLSVMSMAAQADIIIIDFGTTPDADKSDTSESAANYGGTPTVDNPDSAGNTLTGFAQRNWRLDGMDPSGSYSAFEGTPVDLTAIGDGETVTITGDATIDTGATLRVFFYDNDNGVAAVNFNSSWTGSQTFTLSDMNLFSSDGFGNAGDGSVDWANITNIGFRGQHPAATGNATYLLDEITVVPEPASLALAGLGALMMARRERREPIAR